MTEKGRMGQERKDWKRWERRGGRGGEIKRKKRKGDAGREGRREEVEDRRSYNREEVEGIKEGKMTERGMLKGTQEERRWRR